VPHGWDGWDSQISDLWGKLCVDLYKKGVEHSSALKELIESHGDIPLELNILQKLKLEQVVIKGTEQKEQKV
jgi:hypothetical protein